MKFESRWGRNGFQDGPAIGNTLVPQELLSDYRAVEPVLKANGFESGFAPVWRLRNMLSESPRDPQLLAVRRFQKLFTWHQQIAAIDERTQTEDLTGRQQMRLARERRLLVDRVIFHNQEAAR